MVATDSVENIALDFIRFKVKVLTKSKSNHTTAVWFDDKIEKDKRDVQILAGCYSDTTVNLATWIFLENL